jgi:hypothetical protein
LKTNIIIHSFLSLSLYRTSDLSTPFESLKS